jgi:hypothetical protein
MKNRDEKVAEFTKDLMQGGWSSVYNFVDSHIEDWELDDEDEEDNNSDDRE